MLASPNYINTAAMLVRRAQSGADAGMRALWLFLSPASRAWLARHRTRIFLIGEAGFALDGDARVVAAVLFVAYLAQPPPRHGGIALLPALSGIVIGIWIAEFLGSLGLADYDVASLTLWSAIGLAAVACTRLIEWAVVRVAPDTAADELPLQGILLGANDQGWVEAPAQCGALVIGPPRSGKTSGVVIPNVLAWPGPVVSTSTRRDVVDACAGFRLRRGRVWCSDPLGVIAHLPPGVERFHWSPLRGCDQWHVALVRARSLLAGAARGVVDATHWEERGTQLLAALLHAAASSNHRMSAVVEWVHASRHEPAQHLLEASADARPRAVLEGIARTPDRERGSIWSAVAGALSAFDAPAVAESADRAADLGVDPAQLLDGRNTLFIVAPSDQQANLAPIVVGLVEDVRAAALRRSDRAGGLTPPLLLALDEVANICPLPSLPAIASEGGGRNIILLAALQDLSQAAERWGREAANGLLTLAGAKLLLPGIADAETLSRVELLCGTEWVPQTSWSRTYGSIFSTHWSATTTLSPVQQPQLPAADIRRLPSGNALCLIANRPHEVITVASVFSTDPFRRWISRSPLPSRR